MSNTQLEAQLAGQPAPIAEAEIIRINDEARSDRAPGRAARPAAGGPARARGLEPDERLPDVAPSEAAEAFALG